MGEYSASWQLMRNRFRCESDRDPNEKINHLLVFEDFEGRIMSVKADAAFAVNFRIGV